MSNHKRDNVADRSHVKLCVLEDTLDRRDHLLEQIYAQLHKLRPRELCVEVSAVAQLVDRSRRVRAQRQVPLRALARGPRETDSARIPVDDLLALPPGLTDEVRHHPADKVLAKIVPPDVALTSNTPSSIVRRETPNV